MFLLHVIFSVISFAVIFEEKIYAQYLGMEQDFLEDFGLSLCCIIFFREIVLAVVKFQIQRLFEIRDWKKVLIESLLGHSSCFYKTEIPDCH